MSAMFWLLFDPGKLEYVAINKCGIEGFPCNTDSKGEDLQIGQVSMEFSHFIGHAMWACYQGITVILLINILIAMMNTTFSKIWQAADTAWKYSKSFYQVEFLDSRAILPPPFRYKTFFVITLIPIRLLIYKKTFLDTFTSLLYLSAGLNQ